jgi:integrase
VLAPIGDQRRALRRCHGKDGKPKKRSAVSSHVFRHTCASLLFEAGRNVEKVQEWLGHADPEFTLRTYVHLMDAGIGDAAFFDTAVRPEAKARKIVR